jgi:energy-coupling factor transporter ATP-binding protein EcfA2
MTDLTQLGSGGYSNRDKLSTLIDLSLKSLNVKTLTIEERYGNVSIRPELHLLIVAESGAGKSTLLRNIANLYPKKARPEVYTDITNAGLVGSISKDGEIILGGAAEAFMKPLLIDEFTMQDKLERSAAMNGMLQILESGYYTKKVGFRGRGEDKNLGNPSGYYFRVKDGTISVRTKTVGILATMRRLERSLNPATDALVSRCIPFVWKILKEEIIEMLHGKTLIKPIDVSKKFKDVVISKDDYERILNFVIANVESKHILARAVCDCCRVFAILGNHDEGLYKMVCDLKKAFEESRVEYFMEKKRYVDAKERWKGEY